MNSKSIKLYLKLELVFLASSIIFLILDFIGVLKLPQYTSASFLAPLPLFISQIVVGIIVVLMLYKNQINPTIWTAILFMFLGLFLGYFTGIFAFVVGLFLFLEIRVF